MPDFAALPGHWTPVMPAAELGANPVGLTVAGERLALFRGENGPAAVADRCPHRGVSLTAGGKVAGGLLSCPFHGWQFDAQGRCRHVPFNPGVPTGPLQTRAVAVREALGMIWVYTAWGTEVAEPLPLPEVAAMPEVKIAVLYEDWDAHWTRVMENMLDTPHLPFVHRSTIGADMARRLTAETRLHQRIEETASGFEVRFHLDDDKDESRVLWARPNGMVLYILDQPGRRMRLHVWCVPLEQDRTRLIVASGYDFGAFTPLMLLGAPFNRRVVFEDRAVVESSSPKEIPPPGAEANVPTDKVTLRFRTWYYREIVPGLRQAA